MAADMGNVVELGRFASDKVWSRSGDYIGLIRRLVGYYLLMDYRNNEDAEFSISHIKRALPDMGNLTQAEFEFVEETAQHVYYEWNAEGEIDALIDRHLSTYEGAA